MTYRNDDCQETDTSKGAYEKRWLADLEWNRADAHVRCTALTRQSIATRKFIAEYTAQRVARS